MQQRMTDESPNIVPSYAWPRFTTTNGGICSPIDGHYFEEDLMPEEKDNALLKEHWQGLLTLAAEILGLTHELYKVMEERFNLTEAPASAISNSVSRTAYLDTIANGHVAHTWNCLQLSENIRKIYMERDSNPKLVLALVESRFELVMERFALNLEYRAFAQERSVPARHAARAADNEMEIAEASINIFLCIERFLLRYPRFDGYVQKAVEGLFGPTCDRSLGNMVLTGRS